MYWPECDKRVMGVKTTHGVHNTASALGFLVNPVSLLAAKPQSVSCPNCGGPVRKGRKGILR